MPGLLVSAAHKSSGKTTISVGLCAALHKRGTRVQAFKKGPDYIDPLWLGRASTRPCYNLDFNTQSHDEISALYARFGSDAEINLVEGNKGLYDGMELDGSNSNAALAALLGLPVILVIDCQGMTRGIAPLVRGYLDFEPRVRIAGIILNKVGGDRHEQKLRDVLHHYTDVPVLGAVQRDPELVIDERHLGLVPTNEIGDVGDNGSGDRAQKKLDYLGERIGAQVDLDAVARIANQAGSTHTAELHPAKPPPPSDIRIGIPRDRAFAFYYPDDLAQFRRCGAEPVFFDSLRAATLPMVDALFIGGGFPETQMHALQANTVLRTEIRQKIEAGLPVYAECGGMMYLCDSITWNDESCTMVGIIPATAVMNQRPAGRGYTRLRATADLPWHQATGPTHRQTVFSAHEFHYSSLHGLNEDSVFGFEVQRGTGIDGHHDGFVYKNLVACYTHQRHTLSNPWITQFTDFVRRQRHLNSPQNQASQ